MRAAVTGFRMVGTTGVLVWAAALSMPGRDPAAFGGETCEGRAQRERLAAAQADLDRLARAWMPNAADLAGAPLIDGWSLVIGRSGAVLLGCLYGHAHIRAGRASATSMMIAIDARTGSWARTVSRFYLLGRPAGQKLVS